MRNHHKQFPVILVDQQDKAMGRMEKMRAHREAKLHRAFSVMIFNRQKEMLLQRRARKKYHSGGKWTNACCSHPRPGERTVAAAHRRLKEEMGFDCALREKAAFIYRARFSNGLCEHEYDHIFTGRYDGAIKPDPAEVEDYRWLKISDLRRDIKNHPRKYTPWFRIIMARYQPRWK